MRHKTICLLTAVLSLAACAAGFKIQAQSADAKACTCWSEKVSPDHMLATSAFYGRIGVKLTRDMELKPENGQPVRFEIPALPVKPAACRNYYSIYITDENNRPVRQSEGTNPSFNHTFTGCGQTFTVQLMTFSKPPSGSGGPCTRRITFKVKPPCR